MRKIIYIPEQPEDSIPEEAEPYLVMRLEAGDSFYAAQEKIDDFLADNITNLELKLEFIGRHSDSLQKIYNRS